MSALSLLLHVVAPYVGAWIETGKGWGTGVLSGRSHPTWVRGLKHSDSRASQTLLNVAPYVGAWIETSSSLFLAS